MKNADIRRKANYYGVEWQEIAVYLQIPMKDLVRRLNEKQVTPAFRRNLLKAIDSIRKRPEEFYDDFRY